MPVLKCKMCGGDFQVNAELNYAVCCYCGTTTTLPKAADDRRANLFNRANHFRRQNEFDKAMEAYENILNEDNADAEAHWGIALCRYGIEYVEDPASHKRVPTCHRMQYESILADPDYQAAREYAPDGYSRGLYEAEAQTIAEIQKSILAISQKEAPFDVFICYKETSAAGTRSKDSVIAQDIYYQLTQAGYRVFFSRITLESQLGSAYEPYIFSALNSARVMLVVGTSAEHLNAVWVKNEWSRFLDIVKKDPNRMLIPCYQGMDPYEMPDKLSHLQSQDMSKIGFLQDLLHGVKKVLDAGKTQPGNSQTQTSGGGQSNVEALLKRAGLFLEEGSFDKAAEYFDRVLDADPECARAYMGKYLAEKQLKSEKDIVPDLVTSFKEKMKNIYQERINIPQIIDVDAATEEAVGALYENWIGEEKELDDWLYSDYSYASNVSAVANVERNFITPDKNNQNYQQALRFASAAEKETYNGYLKMLHEEIEPMKAYAKQKDDKILPQLKNKYLQYISQIIPLLQELLKVQEKILKCSSSPRTIIFNFSCVVFYITFLYFYFYWLRIETYKNTISPTLMLMSLLVPICLFAIGLNMLIRFNKKLKGEPLIEQRDEIYRSLSSLASSSGNEKVSQWVQKK